MAVRLLILYQWDIYYPIVQVCNRRHQMSSGPALKLRHYRMVASHSERLKSDNSAVRVRSGNS